ncbi:MAG TPA: amylo-alpha-1,6-glucosidase, partial [Chitinophagaceae bacterium]|nr:amylo-alpha-1,6-glucosidase [Chitinophagaceae bacterium]
MVQKDTATVQQFEKAIALEWLETNGLGGWSSSSIIGCHTRRYHGLLVAATLPPADRMSLVSKLDETLVIDDDRFELGCNDYGDAIHPHGYAYADAFKKDLFPSFTYRASGVEINKTIGMLQGENTVVIRYKVTSAPAAFIMELLPLLSVRGYHQLQTANNAIHTAAHFADDVFSVTAYEHTPDIFIQVPGARFTSNPQWFYNVNYRVETYRGLEDREELFSHGVFTVTLKEGDELFVVVSTENPRQRNIPALFNEEAERRKALLGGIPCKNVIQQLVLAADQFIVQREQHLKTIIAGYHWFTDWGRDTMIALPGLTLSTGRFEDAKKILLAFAGSVSMGMLPNRFQDNGDPPEYNNADGTLWYFIAVFKYLQATNHQHFVLEQLLPSLKEIINWHFSGTRYQIHVAADGLLYAGEPGQQLTWMDARIDQWVVTPRMGKPVEIQALWYNALIIYAQLLERNQQPAEAALAYSSAQKVKESFLQQFWYTAGNYLYDNINEHNEPVHELRPNQLFAISLPFSLVEGEKAQAVLQTIQTHLYTPVGLRSLAANDPHYTANYGGDRWQRDAAYHQGTVWSWLLGPYIDALVKLSADKAEAKEVIKRFSYHLEEACIGSISEIFDGAAPHHPRGCIAQAWSVAELLRVTVDYTLIEEENSYNK